MSFISIANEIANIVDNDRKTVFKYYKKFVGKHKNHSEFSAQYALKKPKVGPSSKIPPGLLTDEYIPKSTIDYYLAQINSTDRKTRMKAYKNLSKVWIQSPELFDYLNDAVLKQYKNYTSFDKAQKDELVWQMKALASSGVQKYASTLNTIIKNSSSKGLKKRAKSYRIYLNAREDENDIVHDIFSMSPGEPWQVNQLGNMLRIGDRKLTDTAIAIMYKQFKRNPYLLDIMAKRLASESKRFSFRSSVNEGNYAWFCRILGESGDRQYISLLTDLSKTAHQKKVRKYAKKYARILKKS